MNKLLKLGDSDIQVLTIRQILKAQGFDPGNPDSKLFDQALDDQVHTFQSQHIGPDKKPLLDDGEVGNDTWWALEHPSGADQKSNLGVPAIPQGLTRWRQKVLTIAIQEYKAGVHEVPDGANTGDGVTKFLLGNPAQWCCAFVSWVYHEATGQWPFGVRQFSTWAAWQYCLPKGMFKDNSHTPIPGDFMLIQHKRGGSWTHTGHIGIVLAVGKNRQEGFNTIAGNEGNRVKFGLRHYSQPVGFLNVYPANEQPVGYETGLVSRQELGNVQTT